jgi:hypothetical protein
VLQRAVAGHLEGLLLDEVDAPVRELRHLALLNGTVRRAMGRLPAWEPPTSFSVLS